MTPTRESCLEAAARALVEGCAQQDALTPRQAAEEAHRPGGPSVDELEQLIRAERAQAQGPLERSA